MWKMTRFSSWHSGHRQIARWDMTWLPTSTVPGCYERSGDGLGGLSQQWRARNRIPLHFGQTVGSAEVEEGRSHRAARIVEATLRETRQDSWRFALRSLPGGLCF